MEEGGAERRLEIHACIRINQFLNSLQVLASSTVIVVRAALLRVSSSSSSVKT